MHSFSDWKVKSFSKVSGLCKGCHCVFLFSEEYFFTVLSFHDFTICSMYAFDDPPFQIFALPGTWRRKIRVHSERGGLKASFTANQIIQFISFLHCRHQVL